MKNGKSSRNGGWGIKRQWVTMKRRRRKQAAITIQSCGDETKVQGKERNEDNRKRILTGRKSSTGKISNEDAGDGGSENRRGND